MKKGQAVLEFIMIYGWAFLVLLIMIGALAYFGVLELENLNESDINRPHIINCNGYDCFIEEVNPNIKFCYLDECYDLENIEFIVFGFYNESSNERMFISAKNAENVRFKVE